MNVLGRARWMEVGYDVEGRMWMIAAQVMK
jgi:hypothetical protein